MCWWLFSAVYGASAYIVYVGTNFISGIMYSEFILYKTWFDPGQGQGDWRGAFEGGNLVLAHYLYIGPVCLSSPSC